MCAHTVTACAVCPHTLLSLESRATASVRDRETERHRHPDVGHRHGGESPTVPYSTHTTIQFMGCMTAQYFSRTPPPRGPARTDEPPRHDTGRGQGNDDASSTHTASPLLAYLRGPRCPLALLPALVPLALAARGGGSRYLICHCPPSAISRSKTQWSSTEYGSSAVPRPPTCGGGGAWGGPMRGKASPLLPLSLAHFPRGGYRTLHWSRTLRPFASSITQTSLQRACSREVCMRVGRCASV